jgi:hypothetical protein
LYEKLGARFHNDPSKKESLDWILSVVHAYRGKESAVRGDFKEARYHFKEARRLNPSGRHNRWRYVRTFFPSGLRRFVFPG